MKKRWLLLSWLVIVLMEVGCRLGPLDKFWMTSLIRIEEENQDSNKNNNTENSNGNTEIWELDPTFDNDGIVYTDIGGNSDYARSVAIQSDGKIVVVGMGIIGMGNGDFALVRYKNDGSLDSSFDGDGKLSYDAGSNNDNALDVKIQSDGKIVIAGYNGSYPEYDLVVARYKSDGNVDLGFNGIGISVKNLRSGYEDYGNALGIQTDGNILVAGSDGYNDMVALRYLGSNGNNDPSFGGGTGIVTTDFSGSGSIDYSRDLAIQSDGKILVVGRTKVGSSDKFAIVRYNIDGSLDTSFDGDGKVMVSIGSGNDIAQAIGLQSDGKIIVAGYSYNGTNNDFVVVRFNSDGSLDTSFDGDGKVTIDIGNDDYGLTLFIRPDNKILIGGRTNVKGTNDCVIVRLNSDGSLDTSFDSDGILIAEMGGTQEYCEKMAVQSDGKIILVGFTNANPTYDFMVLRFRIQ